MARHQLHNQNCLEILPQIPSGSVDLILADIPSGATRCDWDQVISFPAMWEALYRVAKPKAAIVLFATQPPFSDDLRLSNRADYRYTLYWPKNMVSGFANANIQPLRALEEVCVFYRSQPTYNPQLRRSRITDRTFRDGAPNGRTERSKNEHNLGVKPQQSYFSEDVLPTNVLEGFPCVPRALGTLHPTEKPVELCEYLIKTYSNEGDQVLDFTAGSFSCGVACLNTNRRFIGIEQKETFFTDGSERMRIRQLEIDGMLIKPWQLAPEIKNDAESQATMFEG